MLRDVCVQQEKLLQEIDAFGPGCPMPRTSVPSSPTTSSVAKYIVKEATRFSQWF